MLGKHCRLSYVPSPRDIIFFRNIKQWVSEELCSSVFIMQLKLNSCLICFVLLWQSTLDRGRIDLFSHSSHSKEAQDSGTGNFGVWWGLLVPRGHFLLYPLESCILAVVKGCTLLLSILCRFFFFWNWMLDHLITCCTFLQGYYALVYLLSD